jgi:hypothetical protein
MFQNRQSRSVCTNHHKNLKGNTQNMKICEGSQLQAVSSSNYMITFLTLACLLLLFYNYDGYHSVCCVLCNVHIIPMLDSSDKPVTKYFKLF